MLCRPAEHEPGCGRWATGNRGGWAAAWPPGALSGASPRATGPRRAGRSPPTWRWREAASDAVGELAVDGEVVCLRRRHELAVAGPLVLDGHGGAGGRAARAVAGHRVQQCAHP